MAEEKDEIKPIDGREHKEVVRSGKDPLQVFDFTEAEETVVNSLLEHGAQSVSKLGRTANLPRTTVYSALQRLAERGLVRRKSKGYRSVWTTVSPTKLKRRVVKGLEHLDRELTAEQLEAELGIQVSETADFFTVRGVDAMLQIYQWMAINHFNQQLCSVRPNTAEKSSESRKLNKMAETEEILKDNKVVLQKMSFREAKQVLSGATTTSGTELVMGRNSAFLANWDEETLTLIKNPELVAVLHGLLEEHQRHTSSSPTQ